MHWMVIAWILAGIAAFRLWESVAWLSVLVIVLAVSYGVHSNENAHHKAHGEYSDATATRLGLTFLGILGIFLYSLSSA